MFLGRETCVAGGFGLIHGLAFAGTIVSLGLRALTILGFNLGIEVMQLVVMLVTVPWLILLARTRLYPALLLLEACFLGWLRWAGWCSASPSRTMCCPGWPMA